MIYTSTISSTSLRVRECRIIADLLLQRVSEKEWTNAVVEQNVLKMGKAVTIIRSSNILRARLEPLGEGLWRMVRDGAQAQATQAALAGAIKHSRLLGDFMDIAMREQKSLFAKTLEKRVWTEYIAGCRGRDPDMPYWSDATVAKLRSIVFSMLAEAEYLKGTRNPLLQNVFVDAQLSAYLRDGCEDYVLRCLEVME